VSLEEYRSDEEALIGLARQLSDAFEEARSEVDRDYAADAIDDFLSDHDEYAPDEALIAFLGLPMTKQTWPLVDRVETVLAGRGSAVLQALLLAASGGSRYDPEGRVPARALEALRAMREADLIRGLVGVLSSSAGDELKIAAVGALAEVGTPSVSALEATLSDPVARRWAAEALEGIRAEMDGRKTVGDRGTMRGGW
jgi:HEAT repeat protein